MQNNLIKYKDLVPNIDQSTFIAHGALIIGDVTIGRNSSIWFNAVVRGDVAPISIGENTNIQDGSVIHTSRFNGPTVIGDNVTVGHMALIHACTVEDNAFIGMQSTVMDKAIIEEFGFLGAGSLLPSNKIIKKYELWLGRPAKFIRNLSDEEKEFMLDNFKSYVTLAKNYHENC